MKDGEVTRLPDGSAFFTASWPLPKDHWLYEEGLDAPPAGLRVGTDDPKRKELEQYVVAAAQFAVRAATLNGKDMDFDPDALVQSMVVGLLGYYTPDGHSRIEMSPWENTDAKP